MADTDIWHSVMVVAYPLARPYSVFPIAQPQGFHPVSVIIVFFSGRIFKRLSSATSWLQESERAHFLQ